MPRTAAMTALQSSPSTPNKGTLTLVEYVPTKGQSPRNFEIDPSGTLTVRGQSEVGQPCCLSHRPKTGRLTPTGKVLEVATASLCEICADRLV